MIHITLVPTEHVANLWHIVGPMLDRAVAHSGDRTTIEDAFHAIIDGDETLWLAMKGEKIIGCATVRVIRYPTGLTTLAYELLAGENVGEWMHQAHGVMLRYGKEYGCDRIEIPFGRKGWLPLLKELGFSAHAIRYEFELKDKDDG